MLILINNALMANQGQNKSREENGSHGLVNRKKLLILILIIVMLLTNQKQNKRREKKEMVGRMCREHSYDWVRVQESEGWEKNKTR